MTNRIVAIVNGSVLVEGREVPTPDSITYRVDTGRTELGYEGPPIYVGLGAGGGGVGAETVSGAGGGAGHRQEEEHVAGQSDPAAELASAHGVVARAHDALAELCEELDALREENTQLRAELAAERANR